MNNNKGLENLHIAVIMDGNGRWAKKRGLPRFLGHKEGVKTVKKIITHTAKNHLKALSIFAFSAENWLRPKEEVSFLMNLLDEYVVSEWDTITKNNIRFVMSGKAELIPEKTRQSLLKLKEETKNNTGLLLNMALSYSAQDELVDCMKQIAKKVQKGSINIDDISKDTIRDNLYNSELPDVDLLIRTSGEQRISNFMLWRISYAELYFTDKLWPDFNEKDFDKAIDEFNKRVRRFGKTDEQLNNN